MKKLISNIVPIFFALSLILAACATPAPTTATVVQSISTAAPAPSTPMQQTNASPVPAPAKDTSTPTPAPGLTQTFQIFDPIVVVSGQGAKNFKTIPPTVLDPKEEEKYLDPVKKVFEDGTRGFVTNLSPVSDFVYIVTGLNAEGWVAKKTIKKVAPVAASGMALYEVIVLPTKDAKVDITRVFAHPDNVYLVVLREHVYGNIVRLDIEGVTVFFGPSDGAVAIRYNFECTNHAPRTYSFSMISLEASNTGSIAGRSAPQINPCKP